MEPELELVIGNKNYSSWSLRPWLLLTHAGIPFQERCVSFNDPDFKRKVAPTGKVPMLVDGGLKIWDSLAIAEYVAECFPDRGLWPADRAARAVARSLCAEMHSSFTHLRNNMAMNCTARLPGLGWNVAVQNDIDRIVSLWTQARARHDKEGPFLFGTFSIPDAFFAPVTRRFITYDVRLPEVAVRYVATIDALPAMQSWLAAAAEENDFVVEDEMYRRPP